MAESDAAGEFCYRIRVGSSVGARSARDVNGPTIGRRPLIAAKAVDTHKRHMDRRFGISHRLRSIRLALQAELSDLSSHCAMT